MIIKYSDTNENRIYWQHRRGGEWKTAELDELIGAYEREKTGKWIPVTNGRGGFECNKCHNYAPSYQDGVEWLSDFCPNCGARMVD